MHNQSVSLLDHFWVNFDQPNGANSNIVFTGITDHFPIIYSYHKIIHSNQRTKITYRKVGEIFDNRFKVALQSSNLDEVLNIEDVDQAFLLFNDIVYKIYDESYPQVTKYVSSKNLDNPWITLGIKQSVKNKNKLYKKFIKRPIT